MNKIYKVTLLKVILISSCIFIIFSNVVAQNNYQAILDPVGDVDGYVTNGSGQAINGAIVGIDGIGQTTTNPTGYYLFEGLPVGMNVVVCFKEGFNTNTIIVIQDDTLNLDITLTQPNISVSPSFFSVTLNPNEFLTQYMSLLNTGDGEGEWEAVINYPPSSSSAINTTTVSANQQDFSFIDYTQTNVISIPVGSGGPMSSRSGFDCPDGTVFSNPARDEVHVRCVIPMESIRNTNYMGQIYYSSEIGNLSSIRLNTTSFPMGVYLIQIVTKHGITTKRVIIN